MMILFFLFFFVLSFLSAHHVILISGKLCSNLVFIAWYWEVWMPQSGLISWCMVFLFQNIPYSSSIIKHIKWSYSHFFLFRVLKIKKTEVTEICSVPMFLFFNANFKLFLCNKKIWNTLHTLFLREKSNFQHVAETRQLLIWSNLFSFTKLW